MWGKVWGLDSQDIASLCQFSLGTDHLKPLSLNCLLGIFQATWGDMNSGPESNQSFVLFAKFQETLPILQDLIQG